MRVWSCAGANSASHQSSTLRASLENELAASGPTASPPVDVPGGFRRAAAADAPQLPQFGKPQQQPYTRLVSCISMAGCGFVLRSLAVSRGCIACMSSWRLKCTVGRLGASTAAAGAVPPCSGVPCTCMDCRTTAHITQLPPGSRACSTRSAILYYLPALTENSPHAALCYALVVKLLHPFTCTCACACAI